MKMKNLKRFGIMVLAIMLVVVSLTGCFTYTPTTTTTKRSYSANTTTTTAKQNVTQYVHQGESITINGLKITYKSCEEWYGYNPYLGPASGNKVIRVFFVIENVSSADISTGYLDFDCYADGMSTDNYIYGLDNALDGYVNISSGRKTQGYIYYEVPDDAEEIEIEYDVSYSNNKKVIFVIELD